MYCHSCGNQSSQQMKYCNRCGTQLLPIDTPAVKKAADKRLDNYLEGLFWSTVLGLGAIVGGLVILRKTEFPDWVLVVYLVVSSTAFLVNVGINLWASLRQMKSVKEIAEPTSKDTGRIGPGKPEEFLNSAPITSVTDHTTRSFEPILKKTETE